MKKDTKKILEILSRLDERLSVLEGGKVSKRQPRKVEEKPKSKKERIAERVRNDLKTKQIVVLGDYCKRATHTQVKHILEKDASLRVITEGRKVYVLKSETAPKDERVIIVRGKKTHTRKHPAHQGKSSNQIRLITLALDSGRDLSTTEIARLIGRSYFRARKLLKRVAIMHGYTLQKRGKEYFLTASKAKPVEGHHEPPMHKKTAYTAFIQKVLRQLRNEGMSNADAWRIATARWNESKAGRVPQEHPKPETPAPSAPQTEFPAFRAVKSELHPILYGVIKNLAKKGIAIDYRSIAYALDITTETEYKTLIEEIITDWEQINAHFGTTGRLSWDGKTLSLRQ